MVVQMTTAATIARASNIIFGINDQGDQAHGDGHGRGDGEGTVDIDDDEDGSGDGEMLPRRLFIV